MSIPYLTSSLNLARSLLRLFVCEYTFILLLTSVGKETQRWRVAAPCRSLVELHMRPHSEVQYDGDCQLQLDYILHDYCFFSELPFTLIPEESACTRHNSQLMHNSASQN